MPAKIKLSQQQIQYILSEYQKRGTNSIAAEFGCTQKVIKRILNENSIELRFPTKIKTLNDDYFETIDTEEKAYFLGFMFADGCVTDGTKRQKRIIISIQSRDIEILTKFKKAINYSGDIKVRTRPNKPKHHKEMANLDFCSEKMANDLIDKGCVPRKSLILKAPSFKQVPEHLVKHFIRGVFDGDGSIHSSIVRPNYESFIFEIVGTKSICDYANFHIAKALNTPLKSLIKRKNIFMYPVGGNAQIKHLYNWLYSDSTIWLQRKKNKFKTLFLVPNSTKVVLPFD